MNKIFSRANQLRSCHIATQWKLATTTLFRAELIAFIASNTSKAFTALVYVNTIVAESNGLFQIHFVFDRARASRSRRCVDDQRWQGLYGRFVCNQSQSTSRGR